jgi:hypothetical protein
MLDDRRKKARPRLARGGFEPVDRLKLVIDNLRWRGLKNTDFLLRCKLLTPVPVLGFANHVSTISSAIRTAIVSPPKRGAIIDIPGHQRL